MQSGYLSLLYSTSKKPLENWSKEKSKTGSIRRLVDLELNENVLEIQDAEDSNCHRTWIMCPPEIQQVLDIRLPFLVIILYNMNKPCLFQLQVIDTENVKHLINYSNFEIKKSANSKSVPPRFHLVLQPGWNTLELDLKSITKIFSAEFEALCRLKICANCRIRRICFSDKRYDENELSLDLYHGFLDNYMLKWGIDSIERSTQTKKTSKSLALSKEGARPLLDFGKLFLRNLQIKSEKVMDEFGNKKSVKFMKEYLEFKKKAKIKPYFIPDGNKSTTFIKSSDSGLMDLNEIKKNFVNENIVYSKIAFEEAKKIVVPKPDEKKDSKYSVYKVRKYPYSEISTKKISSGKNEKPIKYTNYNKFDNSTISNTK